MRGVSRSGLSLRKSQPWGWKRFWTSVNPSLQPPPNQWGARPPGDVVSQAGLGLILCARSPLTHTRGAASAKGALRRPHKGSKTSQTKCVRILARAIWSLINQKKMSETTETNRSSFCLDTSFHFPLWPHTGVGGTKARLPRGSQTPAVRAISGLQAWYFAVNWPDHDLLLV